MPSGDTAYVPDWPTARTVRPAGERISISLFDDPVDRCDWRTKPPFASTAKLSTTVPFSRRNTVSPKRIVSSRAYAVPRVATAPDGEAVVAGGLSVPAGVVGGVVGTGVGTELLGDGIEVVEVGRAGAGEGPGPCADQRVGTATATTAAAATAPMAALARWSRRRRTRAAGAKSPGTSTVSACLRSVARSSRSSWSRFMA